MSTNIKMIMAFAMMSVFNGTSVNARAEVAIKTSTNKTDQKKGSAAHPIPKLVNNGKILSEKGFNSLRKEDIRELTIKEDTLLIVVSGEALKNLEKDSENFIGKFSPKKRQTKQKP